MFSKKQCNQIFLNFLDEKVKQTNEKSPGISSEV